VGRTVFTVQAEPVSFTRLSIRTATPRRASRPDFSSQKYSAISSNFYKEYTLNKTEKKNKYCYIKRRQNIQSKKTVDTKGQSVQERKLLAQGGKVFRKENCWHKGAKSVQEEKIVGHEEEEIVQEKKTVDIKGQKVFRKENCWHKGAKSVKVRNIINIKRQKVFRKSKLLDTKRQKVLRKGTIILTQRRNKCS
jgi:hypothetical protein